MVNLDASNCSQHETINDLMLSTREKKVTTKYLKVKLDIQEIKETSDQIIENLNEVEPKITNLDKNITQMRLLFETYVTRQTSPYPMN